MSVTVDCGEGKHSVCSGIGTHHYLIPQLNDGEPFKCQCPCHTKFVGKPGGPKFENGWENAWDPDEGLEHAERVSLETARWSR